MKLPEVPADKANHMIYGAAIFVVATAATRLTAWADWAPHAGVAVALVLGVVKEARDAWANRQAAAWRLPAPHSVSPADVGATVLGAVVIWLGALVVGA